MVAYLYTATKGLLTVLTYKENISTSGLGRLLKYSELLYKNYM